MNELSTKLTKINFTWLIEHCTDKENWKRSWTLFDYDKFRCVMKIEKININDNELVLQISGNNFYNNGLVRIPMDADNFNEKVFTKSIYNCLSSRIYDYEIEHIKKTELYEDAETKDSNALDDLDARLNEYLDTIGIEDTEIREAYIYKKEDDFYANKYVDEVLDFYKRKILSSHYAMLALQFDMQDDYQEIINLSEIDEEKLIKKFEEIEYEYLDDINELVED